MLRCKVLAQRCERKACQGFPTFLVQHQFEFRGQSMSEPSEPVCHDKLCARQCEDISLKWAGAAPPPLRVVCDEYLPKCHRLSAGVKAIAAMARQWCTDPHNYFLGFKWIQINYFGHVILSDLEPFPFKHRFWSKNLSSTSQILPTCWQPVTINHRWSWQTSYSISNTKPCWRSILKSTWGLQLWSEHAKALHGLGLDRRSFDLDTTSGALLARSCRWSPEVWIVMLAAYDCQPVWPFDLIWPIARSTSIRRCDFDERQNLPEEDCGNALHVFARPVIALFAALGKKSESLPRCCCTAAPCCAMLCQLHLQTSKWLWVCCLPHSHRLETTGVESHRAAE